MISIVIHEALTSISIWKEEKLFTTYKLKYDIEDIFFLFKEHDKVIFFDEWIQKGISSVDMRYGILFAIANLAGCEMRLIGKYDIKRRTGVDNNNISALKYVKEKYPTILRRFENKPKFSVTAYSIIIGETFYARA